MLWHTANDAVLAEGKRTLINDEHRLDGVRVIGVDEHVWRHTRKGDKYVTVVIDLTAIRDRTGPARHGCWTWSKADQSRCSRPGSPSRPRPSATALKSLRFEDMDGFTAFNTATAEELPEAVAVMDPFHVVRLAGDALDRCRRRVQQQLHGHRGRTTGPLYRARRTLHTGTALLTRETEDLTRCPLRHPSSRRRAHHGRGHLSGLPGHGRRLPL